MKSLFSAIMLVLFHPLIVPTLVIAVVFSQPVFYSLLLSLKTKLIISGIILLGTYIFPAFFFMTYKNNPQVSTFFKNNRDHRFFPIFISGLMIFLTYYFLNYVDMPSLYTMPVLFLSFVAVMAMIINFWWNISVELMGWGAFFGAMLGGALFLSFDVLIHLILGLLIAGLSAGLLLKDSKYTQSQIYIGWFAGVLIMLPAFYLV